MNNYSNVPENRADEINLNVLSSELNEIIIKNELVLKKSSELSEKIAACEVKQEYINISLAEAEKIAQTITCNAAKRVEIIIDKAKSVVKPQREQIARIEREIAELTCKTNSEYLIEIKSESPVKDQLKSEEVSIGPSEILREESEYKSDNSLEIVSEEIDTSKNQPDVIEIDESESLSFETLESDDMREDDYLFKDLQNLRETLASRQQDNKQDLSLKEKLSQIFKTKN